MQFIQNKKVLAILGSIVVLVLVVVGLFLNTGIRTTVLSWSTLILAPQEVKSALFISDDAPNHAALYSIHDGTLQKVSYTDATFLEAIRTKSAVIAILKNTTNGAVDIYAIQNGERKPLTTDGKPKQNLALSPDGSMLAFSYVNAPTVSSKGLPEGVTPEDVFDVNRYELAFVTLASNTITDEGIGVYPHFIDDNTLFFVSSKGFVTRDLLGRIDSTLADPLAYRMKHAPIFTSANTFVVQNSVVPEFDTFKIDYVNPLRISAIGKVTGFDGTKTYAITTGDGGVLYGLSHQTNNGKITIIKNSGDTTNLSWFTLPSGFTPNSMIK